MATQGGNTRDSVIQNIMQKKGYDAAGAAEQYDALVATMGSPENEAICRFLAESFSGDTTAEFVATQIDQIPSIGGGVPSISNDPYKNDMTQQMSNANPDASKTTVTTEYSRPILDENTNNIISNMMNEDAISKRTDNTRNCTIETLLLQRPNPSTYLRDSSGQPKKVVIEVDENKMKEYESQLDATDTKSVQAFNEVKAAWQNKTEVPVYVNDDSNRRVIGATINLGGTRRVLTISGLKGFLFTEVLGRIIGKPGVVLSKWEEKRSSSKAGSVAKSVTTLSLKWAGRDSAIKEGKVDYVSEICTPERATEVGYESVNETARLRIAQVFTCIVYSNRSKKNVKRTKRLTGKCDQVPRFVLKKEYEGIFDEVRRKDYVDFPSTPEELNKALKNIDTGLAAIAAGDFVPSGDMLTNSSLNEIVSQIRNATATTSATGTGI